MKFRVVFLLLTSILVFSSASAQETGALTHARGVVNVELNQPYFVTLKWADPFADTKYTATCSPIPSATFQTPGAWVYIFQITQVAPTFVKVEVAANGGPGTVRIDCIALHD